MVKREEREKTDHWPPATNPCLSHVHRTTFHFENEKKREGKYSRRKIAFSSRKSAPCG